MTAILIDPFTDGAVPVKCDGQVKGNYIQFTLGKDGWILQVPIQAVQNMIGSEDLHG